MSDVFYEMSKVTIEPVVNYTVLYIFLINIDDPLTSIVFSPQRDPYMW